MAVTLSVIFKKAMDVKGVKQRDLAKTLGISESRVSHVLNGWAHNMTLETIARFATALGVTIKVGTYRVKKEKP